MPRLPTTFIYILVYIKVALKNLIYRLFGLDLPEPTKEEYVMNTLNDVIKIVRSNKKYFKQLCGNNICKHEHVGEFDFSVDDNDINISVHFDSMFPPAIFFKVGLHTIYNVFGNQFKDYVDFLTTKKYNNMLIDDIYFYCLHELEFRLTEEVKDYKENGNKHDRRKEEIERAIGRTRMSVERVSRMRI